MSNLEALPIAYTTMKPYSTLNLAFDDLETRWRDTNARALSGEVDSVSRLVLPSSPRRFSAR